MWSFAGNQKVPMIFLSPNHRAVVTDECDIFYVDAGDLDSDIYIFIVSTFALWAIFPAPSTYHFLNINND